MARMITNYEKYKEKIIDIIKDDVSSVGCIYQELTGGDCSRSANCTECKDKLIAFLQQETEHPLSEKEIMFCRIAEHGIIERRTNGNIMYMQDKGNGFMSAMDISDLGIFKWLEISDTAFDIEEYLENHG